MPKVRRKLRKIPAVIDAQRFTVGNRFLVAVAKRIPLQDIQNGSYSNTGVVWENNQLTIRPASAPPVESGRFAHINTNGQTVVRRDLPKIEKDITFINPRLFGIPGNSCTVTQTRLVYRREFRDGMHYELEPSVLMLGDDSCILRFMINKQFSSLDHGADQELLFALNLLNEAVGEVGIFSPNASIEDYLGSLHVQWEILPAGHREANIRMILSSFRPRTQEELADLTQRANERYDLFESLHPKHIIHGTGGMSGYMGALVKDDLVVFEHLKPGNSIYVMFGDWTEQSQITKTDLLTNAVEGRDFIRITHTGDWQFRVRHEVASHIH